MPEIKPKLCFVIMPFNEQRQEVFSKAIAPACAQTGFKAVRVDQLEGVYNINQQIIEHIFSSDVIIADLTDWRPNVFYELGVAHSIDNKTIMIIQTKDTVPFDVHSYRCIVYEQNDVGLVKLEKELIASLKILEKWRNQPNNPVQQFKPDETFVAKSGFDDLERQLQQKTEENAKLQQELLHLRSQKSVPKLRLRVRPVKKLSTKEVKNLLKAKNFFDKYYNEQGAGLPHEYDLMLKNGEKIIVDHTTALMWRHSDSPNKMIYADTEKFIHDLNVAHFASYSDWRLPTLEEAMSLMEPKPTHEDWGRYIDPIFGLIQKLIWTADQIKQDQAWGVDFGNGCCSTVYTYLYLYVRAVRTT